MKFRMFISLFFLVAIWIPQGHAHSTPDFYEVLLLAEKQYKDVHDFVCSFHKKERISSGLLEENNILFKYKKPGHFYMRWTEGGNEGQESIFVRGENDDKVVAHPGGLLSFLKVSFKPGDSAVLKNARHPITEADIGNIIRLLKMNYLMSQGDNNVAITFEGEKMLKGTQTLAYTLLFPPGKAYYGHRVHVFFDRTTMLPVKLTVFGWNYELLEEYHYDNLKLNVGLTEKDFNTRNPEYCF